MKRFLKIVGVLVLLVVLLAVALLAPALLGRRSVTDGVEVGGISLVKDGMVSVGLIPLGQGGVALIDAGNDASGRAILDALTKRGLTAKSVSAILITHGHPDHTAAIAAFPDAVVMSLAAEVPLIEGRASAKGPLPRLFPAKPTGVTVGRSLEDGEMFAIGADDVVIRVFAVPGHTAGSAAYLVNDVLFLGDAADAGRDGAVVGSPWVFSDSQADDRASLSALDRRLVEEHATVKALAFAHSGVLTEGLGPLTTFAQSNP